MSLHDLLRNKNRTLSLRGQMTLPSGRDIALNGSDIISLSISEGVSDGMLLGSCGVAFVFHTYIAPEAYELFVKEISAKYGFKIERVKTAYDFTSCIISIALSFIFFGFGHFEAIKVGTIVCAALNGWTIGQINKLLGRAFIFKDAFKLHSIFDK